MREGTDEAQSHLVMQRQEDPHPVELPARDMSGTVRSAEGAVEGRTTFLCTLLFPTS